MKKYYKLYIYHDDIFIAKFKVKTNNICILNKYYTEDIIRDGMIRGMNINQQTLCYNTFCDLIKKQTINCEKIKLTDFMMFMTCSLALHRFNKKDTNDFLFLKIKSNKHKHGCHKQTKI